MDYKKYTSFAEHPKSKFLVDKTIDASKISCTCRIKYLFQCDKCSHQFESAISNVAVLGRWCPYCCVSSRKLCHNDECNECFQKSFAAHPKSKCLVDKTLDPRKLIGGNCKKYDFLCDICNHTFQIQLVSVKAGCWCPYCCIPPKMLCNDDECEKCFDRSFASHPKSKYLTDTSINPRMISIQNDKSYSFDCDKCSHQFTKPIYSITSKNNPSWCPYCVNQKLCDCLHCFYKSFASHPKSVFVVDKSIHLSKITLGADKKLMFECDVCLSKFESAVYHVTSKNNPRWCPFCSNKSEKILHEYLLTIYPDIIYQYRVEWCKNKNHLPFDICIPSLQLIIELDGIQHFRKVSNWGDPDERKRLDIYKMTCAIANGFSVIRILQEDLLYNRIDWKNELREYIKKYDNPVIVFIDKNGMYKDHIDDDIRPYLINEEQ